LGRSAPELFETVYLVWIQRINHPSDSRSTSNQWSIRTIGGKNWKRLHRLAYVAAGLLIYHQAIAGKGHWYIARWLLFSLVFLQLARLAKTFAMKQRVTDHRASMTSN
jgi:DMSO/TMAO reductase YedYZ heme-binding membrane subunit